MVNECGSMCAPTMTRTCTLSPSYARSNGVYGSVGCTSYVSAARGKVKTLGDAQPIAPAGQLIGVLASPAMGRNGWVLNALVLRVRGDKACEVRIYRYRIGVGELVETDALVPSGRNRYRVGPRGPTIL